MPLILLEGVHDGNNQPIVYLKGPETRSLKDKLGRYGLGFTWYGHGSFWWMYKSRLTQDKLKTLSNLGVDVSKFLNETQPDSSPANPEPSIPDPEPSQQEILPELTNKTDYDTSYNYRDVPSPRYMGFNIKRNIYSTTMDANIDGQIVPLSIVMDRWYEKGRRKIPQYIYNISWDDKPVGSLKYQAPGPWGSYDEDQLARDMPDKIQERLNLKDKSKLYLQIKFEQEKSQRDPELVDFISKLDKYKEDKQILLKEIVLKEPPYEGKFSVGFESSYDGLTLYAYPHVEHQLAPTPSTLAYIQLPVSIKTIDDLNHFLDEYMVQNYNEMSEEYIKYLKSFPYKMEDAAQSKSEMIDIINMISNKEMDPEKLSSELISRGYIRPSKRGNPRGQDFEAVPKSQIKWVLDSKKIVNDAYSFRKTDPNDFYAVLAYYLHRKVKNITSFTEMMLTDAVSRWTRLAQRYGHDLGFNEFFDYLDQAVGDLYHYLFHTEAPRSQAEQYEEFYRWFNGGQRDQPQSSTPAVQNAIEDFVTYAAGLGVDPNLARSSPKIVYRELSKKYHPDLNQDPGANDIFIELTKKWNNLPDQIRLAFSNWYKKAQQHLMFYPFQKDTGWASERIDPVSTTPTGEKVYLCHDCGKNILESEITKWFKPSDTKQRQYMMQPISFNDVAYSFSNISSILRPYLIQLEQWKTEASKSDDYMGSYSWEVQIPQLVSLIVNDNVFQQLYATSRYYSDIGNVFNKLSSFKGEMNGSELESLQDFILNPEKYAKEVTDTFNKTMTSFNVDQTEPLCKDCLDEKPRCDDCGEPLVEGDNHYSTTWGSEVCENCNDNYVFCNECGLLESPDDAHVIGDTGEALCDNCYKETSFDFINEIKQDLTDLDIPIGKHDPVSDKTLSLLDNFFTLYAKKYGHHILVNEKEIGRMIHIATKSGMTPEALSYLKYILNKQTNQDQWFLALHSDITKNIETRQFMKERYPHMKNYVDMAFDIDVTDNFITDLPGFTITITPSEKFFDWAKNNYPGIKEVWHTMSRTPHHPGTLAYARCGYDGGDTIVINNLQRDADLDFLEKAMESRGAGMMPDVLQAARWMNRMTDYWDYFLVHIVASLAHAKDKKAYLTSAEMQQHKWARAPKHKTEHTYDEVPSQMGFEQEDIDEDHLIERTRQGPAWRIAANISKGINSNKLKLNMWKSTLKVI